MSSSGGLDSEKTPQEIEKAQEEQLKKKYPGLIGGRGRGRGAFAPHRDHKYFDSADWQLQRDAAKKGAPPPEEEKVDVLPVKSTRSPPPSRRVSHLDSMETARDSQM
uniref:Negatively light-regulated protein n=1 Tax=Tetraselmis sp. GSL018 TaxID=582737 RepID=A0A061SAP0_9CHLO|mmetsp:Transcript_42300/g.100347  ORF Transcript_42300/g.100347 Transcript_42300/m.100347 type:complete len:107 (-) Transcript_42300:309-629(-)|eukprot:CAMPEP_0177607436 /NCGR_PEP_ID=MMETSP0419_2-20121207/17917_1 /TAXON_ID=582737 /ORGANISM="Tetraselmis sp., Strain GSL018" /LENGTH=106 /DNA_ID=CAMNT_0019102019 /DNA_START=109 /DNA_END=429 /DNA_ORIENTATION=+